MERKKRLKKSGQSLIRGFTTIALLILIVIIGSVMLAGGLFPKEPRNSPDQVYPEVEPDPSSLTPQSKEALQLQTLKFKECSSNVTVDLLLDRSNSMRLKTPSGVAKLDRLKEAVLALTNNLSDTSIIGIQSFNSDSITPDVPISYYKDVKSQIVPIVNSYQPGGNTPTHDALQLSYQELQSAIPKFPGRQFNFIFVSDGQPVPGANDSRGPNQDPRVYNPNPADQIKGLGVTVYTLAIYDNGQSGDPALAALMQSIASKPENYYEAKTADDAKQLLALISNKICGSGETTPSPAP